MHIFLKITCVFHRFLLRFHKSLRALMLTENPSEIPIGVLPSRGFFQKFSQEFFRISRINSGIFIRNCLKDSFRNFIRKFIRYDPSTYFTHTCLCAQGLLRKFRQECLQKLLGFVQKFTQEFLWNSSKNFSRNSSGNFFRNILWDAFSMAFRFIKCFKKYSERV